MGRAPLAALCLLMFASAATAQVYRCEDGGRVTFSDAPCAPDARALDTASASSARSGIDFKQELEHYTVSGADRFALWADLQRKGPEGFAGQARWAVGYEYEAQQGVQGCAVVPALATAIS